MTKRMKCERPNCRDGTGAVAKFGFYVCSNTGTDQEFHGLGSTLVSIYHKVGVDSVNLCPSCVKHYRRQQVNRWLRIGFVAALVTSAGLGGFSCALAYPRFMRGMEALVGAGSFVSMLVAFAVVIYSMAEVGLIILTSKQDIGDSLAVDLKQAEWTVRLTNAIGECEYPKLFTRKEFKKLKNRRSR